MGKNEYSLSPDAPGQGIPLGRGDVYIWKLAGHIVLSYSPWAQEHQEMTRSPIGENKMECMAEWVQKDRVAGFHGQNNIQWQKAVYGECIHTQASAALYYHYFYYQYHY